MKDAGFRKKEVGQLLDPRPCGAVLLAAAPKHTPPEAGYVETEGPQCTKIGRHCVVGKEAGDDLTQPNPLLRDGLVHSLPQLCNLGPLLEGHGGVLAGRSASGIDQIPRGSRQSAGHARDSREQETTRA
jgi:hypothetical protein